MATPTKSFTTVSTLAVPGSGATAVRLRGRCRLYSHINPRMRLTTAIATNITAKVGCPEA
jgi:hypothetical protein